MPEISEDTKPRKESKNKRENVLFWHAWLKDAIEKGKCHRKIANEAWEEHENAESEIKSRNEGEMPRCYPAYYTNCKYFEPALFAKTPEIRTRRRFGIDDPLALTQALIVDRIGEWLLEDPSFVEAMQMSRDNFIHADKAANQVYIEEQETGEGYEVEELGEEEDDQAQESMPVPARPKKRIVFKAVQYDEILHTPDAKCQSEIKEYAFLCHASEEEAKERFPDIKDLPLRDKKASVEDDEGSYDPEKKLKDTISERFVSFFEIYCLKSQMVYWVSLDYTDDFLDKKPLKEVSQLRRKVPITPFVINNQPRNHLYPTPIFKQIEPTIKRLHKQYGQIMDWIDAAVPQSLVLSDDEDLVQTLENPKGARFVQAKNHRDMLEKGGPSQLIQDIPVDGLVAAVQQLIALDDLMVMKFDQWFGIPEILKGVSENEKTKAEVETLTGGASDRFTFAKKQIEQLSVNTLEMGVDLVLDHFDQMEIAKITGWEYMTRGEIDPETGEQLSLGHFERFPMALERLKNDDERICRIDIETDSTSFTNQMKEFQKRRQIYDTILEGLSTIGGMKNQEFMKPVSRIFLSLVEATGGSIIDEDAIKQALKEIEAARSQPQEPPPDFTQMKIEAQMQGNQIKAQKDQMDAQLKSRELDRKEYETMLKERELAFKQQLDAMQAQLDETLTGLEVQRVQIEEFKAQTQAAESQLEETRLALEQLNMNKERELMLMTSGMEEEKIKAPEPNIVIVDAKDNSSRRVATVTARDMNGAIKQLVFEPMNGNGE